MRSRKNSIEGMSVTNDARFISTNVISFCSFMALDVHQAKEWPDEQQWPLHTWDYVYSKTTSSYFCSKCIKSPIEQ